MSARETLLASRIQANMIDVERVVDRVERMLAKAVSSGDDDYLDDVALNLHGFYAGVERIFEDVARSIDDALPAGPEWHRSLLVQMAAQVAEIRPAVIRYETRECLDGYRSFRHLVRNVYTFSLRASRVQELARELRPCYQALREDTQSFCAFLYALD